MVEATQSNPDGLLIAEVDYLLQLASYRIALEHNRDGALLAISRAQSRLESSNTGAYQPILEQIAKDKSALETVVTPDVGAVVNSLSALLDRVDELGTGAEKIAPQGESPSSEERETSGWDAFVAAFGENLSQFVEIEEVDAAAVPTLIPNQEYFARENVRISLQNARASAVRAGRTATPVRRTDDCVLANPPTIMRPMAPKPIITVCIILSPRPIPRGA